MDKSTLENLIDRININGIVNTDVRVDVTNYTTISASFNNTDDNVLGDITTIVEYFPNASFVLPESERFRSLLGCVTSSVDITYGPNYITVSDTTSDVPTEIRYLVEDLSIPNPVKSLVTIRSTIPPLPELPVLPEPG